MKWVVESELSLWVGMGSNRHAAAGVRVFGTREAALSQRNPYDDQEKNAQQHKRSNGDTERGKEFVSIALAQPADTESYSYQVEQKATDQSQAQEHCGWRTVVDASGCRGFEKTSDNDKDKLKKTSQERYRERRDTQSRVNRRGVIVIVGILAISHGLTNDFGFRLGECLVFGVQIKHSDNAVRCLNVLSEQ
jgi:hypothetical protein